MILGHGTDVVSIPRMARLVERWDDEFLHRLFTSDEVAYCKRHVESARHFAARFAAKESLYKALSGGQVLDLAFLDAWVANSGGAPLLRLSAHGWQVAAARGANAFHLTISHDGDYAVAHVIAEAR